ncbi:MAG: DUF29 domain-containing protein [Leptospiraceae bacterium]|nr:DUF29 domain-containing protein [Leptospiraceae bacterium]
MQTIDLKKLYEEDEHLWLFENAKLLREGKIELADIQHIAETLEEMGKRDYKEVLSRMRILVSHLLKWKYQKERRGTSWELTITEQRFQLNDEFGFSKNLKKFASENFPAIYEKSRIIASKETELPPSTFPDEPPFTFEQTIDEEYLPE